MIRALDQFRLEAGVFRLGQFAPVSVRDQIVRAIYLIEHLRAGGELANDTRLLVIGAGAAGVTAACSAFELGTRDICVLEQSGNVLPLQVRSDSRWLDPVQYDWPASHWAHQVWPVPETPRRFTAVASPFLTLRAGFAEDWAAEFQNRSSAFFGRGVRGLFYTKASMWRRAGAALEVDLLDLPTKSSRSMTADLIILAAGFGVERCDVPDTTTRGAVFQGLDFWASDDFEAAGMGIPGSGGALVSGSGDGALQDFVRLSVGVKSVRDLLAAVLACGPVNAAWKEAFGALWHWEDHAARARAFAPSPIDACDILRRLHGRFVEAVEQLAVSSEWPAVMRWFDALTAARRVGSVDLCFKCDHFGWCYPLNRLGALIAARCMSERGHQALRPMSALRSTASIGHACSVGCWGQAHEAHMARGVACAHSDSDLNVWPSGFMVSAIYQGLVIRHGIDPLRYAALTLDRLKPQSVPHHLP